MTLAGTLPAREDKGAIRRYDSPCYLRPEQDGPLAWQDGRPLTVEAFTLREEGDVPRVQPCGLRVELLGFEGAIRRELYGLLHAASELEGLDERLRTL